MGQLGPESGLVTITGFLWDCDIGPRTQRGEGANKGVRLMEGGAVGVGKPQGD